MSAQVEGGIAKQQDGIKWVAVVALIGLGVVGNTYYANQYMLVRVLALLVLAVASAAIALRTSQGEAFWELLKEARKEASRVVWPSREESWQTTLLVMAVVVVMSLLLWGVDSLLGLVIHSIIG